MPVGENKTESQKKCSQKKKRTKQKNKSKPGILIKNPIADSPSVNSNQLTPANLSSLRWDDVLTDPIEENDRIERYKELRRQRYIDAQQQLTQNLVEKMKITTSSK